MIRKTRAVTSREYKVMLNARHFDGGKKEILAAAARFQEVLGQAVVKSVLGNQSGSLASGKFKPRSADKQVTVQFADTKDRRLRNSDFVFRQRQPMLGGPIELTLKRRHPDRFYVSGSKTGRKTKFEEDIKATQSQPFISLHSLSGKVKDVDPETKFNTLKDIRQYYKPLKKQLGDAYDAKEQLLRVCNFTALETVLEGVELPISDQLRAECALILWHQEGGATQAPAVVEFSFRYKDAGLGAKQEPFTAEMAKRCFDILQAVRDEDSPIAKWMDLSGPTKTDYAYRLTRM